MEFEYANILLCMLPSTHASEFRKMFENIQWEGGGEKIYF
jgi:hypothetical protein